MQTIKDRRKAAVPSAHGKNKRQLSNGTGRLPVSMCELMRGKHLNVQLCNLKRFMFITDVSVSHTEKKNK